MMNFLIVVSIILLSTSQVFGVDWHEETSLFWAFGCDWSDNDLSSKKGPGEQCGSNCEQTAGCTHFTWTDYEGGTCWMKKNEVSKNQATEASGSAVCGIMKSATSGGGGGGEGGISWHDDADVSWAEMCDFVDNDLSSNKVPGEQCSNTCKGTGGCTHFAWTNYEGGTCWMKKNGATKDQAKRTTEYSVCGIMKATGGEGGGGTGGGTGASVSAHGTMWADQTDVGGCQMPQGSYKIQHALALGQSPDLGSLVWRNGLCGQVLSINCGGQTVEAVVASTCNLGSGTCGVDMIRKTWNAATYNKQPGVSQCTIQLTKTNPLNDGAPACYIRPFSSPQQYFTSLSVFNTGGRIVKSVVAAGVNGKVQSGSGYYDFDGQGQPKFTPDVSVVFNFEDGSSAQMQLKDCKNSNNVQIWS